MDPLVTGVVGGVIGGGLVALIETVLGRFDEHRRWLRDQRQQAFVDLLVAMQETYRKQDLILDGLDPVPVLSEARRGRYAQELQPLRDRGDRALLRISLVATPGLAEKATFLNGSAHEMHEALTWPREEAVRTDRVRDAQLSWDEIDDFVTAARREVGGGRDLRHRVLMAYRRARYRLKARLTALRRPEPGDDGGGTP